jgi:hypothetical protein
MKSLCISETRAALDCITGLVQPAASMFKTDLLSSDGHLNRIPKTCIKSLRGVLRS